MQAANTDKNIERAIAADSAKIIVSNVQKLNKIEKIILLINILFLFLLISL